MFDFQQLDIYKKSKSLHKNIKSIIESLNLHKTVNDQLYCASFSIPLNIAEGSGRFSKPDRRNFFIISRSSIFECVAILDLLVDDNILDEESFNSLATSAEEISKILYAMIKNLS